MPGADAIAQRLGDAPAAAHYFSVTAVSWYSCAYVLSDCTRPTPSANHCVVSQFAGSSEGACSACGLSSVTRPVVMRASFSLLGYCARFVTTFSGCSGV